MNKLYDIIGYIGAILIIAGAVLQYFKLSFSPFLLLIGAVMFAYIQIVHNRYDGTNFIIKRLRRQQILGALLLIASGFMMLFLKNNEWILCLTISAVFELYTAFRIPTEIEKEKK